MAESIRWSAAPELATLLRRYYQGEASLWPTIQAYVHVELRARGLPLAPRHVRFRRIDEGYDVIIEEADAFLSP